MCVVWVIRYEGRLNGIEVCDRVPGRPCPTEEVVVDCRPEGGCTNIQQAPRSLSFPIPCRRHVADVIRRQKEQWRAILDSTAVPSEGNPVRKINTLDTVDVQPRMISYPDVLEQAFWKGPGGYNEIHDLLRGLWTALPVWKDHDNVRRWRHDRRYRIPIDQFCQNMERAGRLFMDNYTGVLPYGNFGQQHRRVRRHFWFDTHAFDDAEAVHLAAGQEIQEGEAPQEKMYGTDSELYDSPRPLLQWNSDSS
ncbi:hypothetical protein QBC40DRAFT_297045 [Triangularia verruculosa]|uniref:Uncharacterized protein n=1 Tax=Triangularia verruculosa TaxID=2587418 RepID=A0AAN7ASY6_9PEZI|nr:hypothetical protein QBC40DRAFT_297045 [Triangularia verruculosa]